MKKNYSLMVRYIMKGYEGIVEEQLAALRIMVSRHWPTAYVEPASCIDYWKFEGDKDIVYGVYHEPRLTVKEFIKIFNITWGHYSEGEVYDVDNKRNRWNETAIWSKLNHPEETFVTPQVEWVHIYTWPEQKAGE